MFLPRIQPHTSDAPGSCRCGSIRIFMWRTTGMAEPTRSAPRRSHRASCVRVPVVRVSQVLRASERGYGGRRRGNGRGSWIRTNDLQYPKLPRYQAALYPDLLGRPRHYTVAASAARPPERSDLKADPTKTAPEGSPEAAEWVYFAPLSATTVPGSPFPDGSPQPSCPWSPAHSGPAPTAPDAARSCRSGAASPCARRCPACPRRR